MDGRLAARRIRALKFVSHLSIACAIPLICAGVWLKIVNSKTSVAVSLPLSELGSALSQLELKKLSSYAIAETAKLEVRVVRSSIHRVSSTALARQAEQTDFNLSELEQAARVSILALEGWEEVDLALDHELSDAEQMRLAYFEIREAFQLALVEPKVESIQLAQAMSIQAQESAQRLDVKKTEIVAKPKYDFIATPLDHPRSKIHAPAVNENTKYQSELKSTPVPKRQLRAESESDKLSMFTETSAAQTVKQKPRDDAKKEASAPLKTLGTLVAENFVQAAVAGDIPEIFNNAEVRKFDYSPRAILVKKLPDLSQTIQSSQTITQPVTQAEAIVVSQAAPRAPVADAKSSDGRSAQSESQSKAVSFLAPSPSTLEWIEAFHWDQKVEGVEREILASEGMRVHSNPEQYAWVKLRASRYFDTIARLSARPQEARAKPTPILSNNTARILASLHELKIQEQAGIVYGVLEKGWSIEFTARSESAIYKEGPEGRAAFILFNAQPGIHLIHVRQNGSARSAAVAVPVLSSTATYLDLAKPELLDLDGSVQDATHAEFKGYSGIQVRAIGSTQRTKSDQRGAFSFKDLVTFAAYPIFLEAQGKAGFKHRFQIERKDRNQVQLFMFPQAQIQEWVSQLSGGISAESGLVVGAIPGLFARLEAAELMAKVHSVTGSGTLLPETYTLNREGALNPEAKLEAAAPRFIAVQIPEGFSIATVQDEKGKNVWSQSFVSSPGVVNVLQPE
jgi:hypothetical protein